jgi:hypothetical protein
LSDLAPDVLSDIRRAAFELRRSDPHEAVRVLRRAASAGGGAEVLARGALGEIYLEEFGDLDGAEHEFRAVLEAAPGLPAAELGLARVLREAGDRRGALQGLSRALEGLSRDVGSFRERKAQGEPLPAGAEEVVLTLLEVAIERAEMDPTPQLDEELLRWAAGARLFDALREEGEAPQEDWVRFFGLWTKLRALTGLARHSPEALRAAEAAGQLPPREAAALLRDVLEDLGDYAGSAGEARRLLATDPQPLDVLRAAALTAAAGDEPRATQILEEALRAAEQRLATIEGEERKALEDAVGRYREALAPGGNDLVSLRVKKQR